MMKLVFLREMVAKELSAQQIYDNGKFPARNFEAIRKQAGIVKRFRIIFQAAKDYGPLLPHYGKWEKIKGQIEELAAAVAELQAAKSMKKA